MRLMMPIIVAAVLLAPPPLARAQSTPDPAGHWSGAIALPDGDRAFEIDIARNAGGELIGTITAADVKNLPLSRVSLSAHAVSFEARSDQPFDGLLADDGATLSGTTSVGGYQLPFSLTRTGEATIEPAPTSPPIRKELEGTWQGVLNAGTAQLRLTLTMTNRPDGRAVGSIVSLDEGGLTVPVVIAQQGASVAIEQRGVAGSYALTLNAPGADLTGTFTQRGRSWPIRMTRRRD